MRHIVRLLSAALALALTFGLGAWAHSALVAEPSVVVGDELVVQGGPIRLGTKMYVHGNTTHAVPGIKSLKHVSRSSKTVSQRCNLVLGMAGGSRDQVISVTAAVDETMARLGVVAGASGGTPNITIHLYRKGKKICPNDKIFGARSNIWLTVLLRRPGSAPQPAPATIKPTIVPSAPAAIDPNSAP